MMKLYKFRPLGDCISFCRAKEILQTRNFWCSNFWQLNDPMEGVFSSDNPQANDFASILNEKSKRVVCSFSDWRAFSNPLLWGYYANGFKGLAFEVEIDRSQVHKVKYEKTVPDLSLRNGLDQAVRIMTCKLKKWRHENEWRWINQAERPTPMKIGTITAVYFGDPYQDTANYCQVRAKSEELCEFIRYRTELEKVANSLPIPCKRVSVSQDGKVVKSHRIYPSGLT